MDNLLDAAHSEEPFVMTDNNMRVLSDSHVCFYYIHSNFNLQISNRKPKRYDLKVLLFGRLKGYFQVPPWNRLCEQANT